MIGMHSIHYLRAGSAAANPYDVDVTPESAGWGHTSLRIVSLPPDGNHEFETSYDEVIILPLQGAVSVAAGGSGCDLAGRTGVFAGPTDVAYVGIE